jgi:hypothetical protein
MPTCPGRPKFYPTAVIDLLWDPRKLEWRLLTTRAREAIVAAIRPGNLPNRTAARPCVSGLPKIYVDRI